MGTLRGLGCGGGSESGYTYNSILSSKAGLRHPWRVEKGEFNSQGNTTNPLFQDRNPHRHSSLASCYSPNCPVLNHLERRKGEIGAGSHPALAPEEEKGQEGGVPTLLTPAVTSASVETKQSPICVSTKNSPSILLRT